MRYGKEKRGEDEGEKGETGERLGEGRKRKRERQGGVGRWEKGENEREKGDAGRGREKVKMREERGVRGRVRRERESVTQLYAYHSNIFYIFNLTCLSHTYIYRYTHIMINA